MGGAQVSKQRNDYICTQMSPDFSLFRNNTVTWMKDIDGNKFLSSLSIPGTHQSLARQGGYAKVITVAQCQSWSLLNQLNSGIRCFDFRGKCKNGQFIGYHGIVNQHLNVRDQFLTLFSFLDQFPSECIIVFMKEEDKKTDKKTITSTFEKMISKEEIEQYFYMINRIPKLKDVRGKIVFVPRWDYRLGLEYSWFKNQDRYNIKVHDKVRKVEEFRQMTLAMGKECDSGHNFFMNYLSGATVKDWPLTYASKTNKQYYQNSISRGIVMMDFPSEKLIDKIIQLNQINFQEFEKQQEYLKSKQKQMLNNQLIGHVKTNTKPQQVLLKE